jgi:hypothetical protein
MRDAAGDRFALVELRVGAHVKHILSAFDEAGTYATKSVDLQVTTRDVNSSKLRIRGLLLMKENNDRAMTDLGIVIAVLQGYHLKTPLSGPDSCLDNSLASEYAGPASRALAHGITSSLRELPGDGKAPREGVYDGGSGNKATPAGSSGGQDRGRHARRNTLSHFFIFR